MNVINNNDEIKIALDMESVLADTHPYFIEKYNKEFNTNYSTCEIDNWDWVRTKVNWEDFDRIMQNGWENNHTEITPREENIDTIIPELNTIASDTTVDIVTGRTGVEREMKEWLTNHDVTQYSDLISTTKKKTQLGYGVYIDDNPNMVKYIQDTDILILIQGPHNRYVDTNKENVISNAKIVDGINKMKETINSC
jgi:5'(3')-deoxyribonucleotidase